jgi:hypothetical protein
LTLATFKANIALAAEELTQQANDKGGADIAWEIPVRG